MGPIFVLVVSLSDEGRCEETVQILFSPPLKQEVTTEHEILDFVTRAEGYFGAGTKG